MIEFSITGISSDFVNERGNLPFFGQLILMIMPWVPVSGVRFRLQVEGFWRAVEWIDHFDIAQLLVFLEVFRKKVPAATHLSGGDDQSIPPGKLITVLNEPRALKYARFYLYRVPCKQGPNIVASALLIQAGLELFRDCYVKFLKDLKAQPACPCVP